MKLNQDCIRDLLLYLEENLDYCDCLSISDIELPDYDIKTILYTAQKLKQAGYISADFSILDTDDLCADFLEITWDGHQFLDTIRDNNVWKKTKSVVSKLSSVSVTIISNVASQVLTNLINQQLGLC